MDQTLKIYYKKTIKKNIFKLIIYKSTKNIFNYIIWFYIFQFIFRLILLILFLILIIF